MSESTSSITEKDLKVFVDVSCRYFEKVAKDKPLLRDPVIEFHKPEFLDYTGSIEISGRSKGNIYLTMPREMVVRLLELHGENEVSDGSLYDLVGEIASTISSNAREHFGSQLKISVPRALGPEEAADKSFSNVRFVLPIEWRDEEAFLVIALEEKF